MQYEKLPIEQYRKKHAEYEAQGLAIPNGSEVELTDWAIQNGLKMKATKNNRQLLFIKVGEATKPSKKGRIKVLHGNDKQPYYYWAGFWKKKN